MIKYIIILMNMLAILVARMFFAGDVTVKLSTPSQVKQGEEFTVSITINKGSIAGVGHMKQELPSSLGNATLIEAKGAEFKYLAEDNVVKFTWISLPSDQEFTISYKVKVKTDAVNGRISLAGKLSYVLNNQKQTFMVPESSILIGEEVLAANTTTQPETTATTTTQPEATTTTTTQPETIVTQPETTSVANTQPESTAVTAKQPETILTQPESTAVVTTQPETIVTTTTQPESTAKTTAQPEATNKPSESTTAATTQPETTTATTPPQEKTSVPVTVSRTIVGSPEAGMEFTVEINVKKDGMKGFARIQEILPVGLVARPLDNKGGTFTFIDQKVKIIWDNLPPDEDVKIAYRIAVADNASGDMAITGSFSYVENDDPKKVEIVSTTISIKAKEKETVLSTANSNTNTTTQNNNNTTVTATANIPEPENKIAYKIQICALSKIQRGTAYFESKFAITSKVNMEFHEGWKKYIVGKYDQYKDARDYRESIRSKGVENPFVTAYNSGKRITVQEALMVSNQQWIR